MAWQLLRLAWALVFWAGMLLLDQAEQAVGELFGAARQWLGRSWRTRFPQPA